MSAVESWPGLAERRQRLGVASGRRPGDLARPAPPSSLSSRCALRAAPSASPQIGVDRRGADTGSGLGPLAWLPPGGRKSSLSETVERYYRDRSEKAVINVRARASVCVCTQYYSVRLTRPKERPGGHFTLIPDSLYREVPGLPGYGDKLRRAIDAADPGAVPGGSTKTGLRAGPDGAELGSTCVEKRCFCPA